MKNSLRDGDLQDHNLVKISLREMGDLEDLSLVKNSLRDG